MLPLLQLSNPPSSAAEPKPTQMGMIRFISSLLLCSYWPCQFCFPIFLPFGPAASSPYHPAAANHVSFETREASQLHPPLVRYAVIDVCHFAPLCSILECGSGDLCSFSNTSSNKAKRWWYKRRSGTRFQLIPRCIQWCWGQGVV